MTSNKFYRIQFLDGSYQHAGYIGRTNELGLSVIPENLIEHFTRLYDETYTLIEIKMPELKPCSYKLNAFEESQDAFIIKETKNFLYIVKTTLNNEIAWSSVEKMPKKHVNTVGLNSSGISLK